MNYTLLSLSQKPDKDGCGTINVTLSFNVGESSTYAGFPFGKRAETGDRDQVKALLRTLKWIGRNSQYKGEEVTLRTIEVHNSD